MKHKKNLQKKSFSKKVDQLTTKPKYTYFDVKNFNRIS